MEVIEIDDEDAVRRIGGELKPVALKVAEVKPPEAPRAEVKRVFDTKAADARRAEAKRAIRDGKIHADAIQFPKRIGAITIDTIARYMAGDTVEKQVLIPTALYRQADAQNDPEIK